MVKGTLRNHSNIGPISKKATFPCLRISFTSLTFPLSFLLIAALLVNEIDAKVVRKDEQTPPLSPVTKDSAGDSLEVLPVFVRKASARSINVITIEKEPQVSGARVESPSDSTSEAIFLGHTEKGESIVVPNRIVQYTLYGFWLDEVVAIAFTVTTCLEPGYLFEQKDFSLQTDKRITLYGQFQSHETEIRLCIKNRSKDKTIANQFEEVVEHRTWLSTKVPPRKYYFPFAVQVTILACLLVLSGLFSGLNLGLMALSTQELLLIMKSGSKTERRYAETILPIRERGNLLLCTLLLGNVCVNSGISILLDDLSSGLVALVVSSAAIVIFGEIFPQSLCVKKGLAVGAHTIFITRFFMVLTFPVAFPISKILDWILGDEVVAYDRKRLMELIKMNAKDENGLAEELKIAVGAMEISDKTVSDVMTKSDDVFMLPDTTVLNTKTVAEILRMGYTRIPVYSGDRNHVVSLLFVKDLALLDPDDNFTIQTVCGYHQHPLRFVMQDTPLRMMLEEFKKGDYHLAMVQRIVCAEDTDPTYELVGVVTLEDIVEEILQAEIVDETDAVTDNVHRIRRHPKNLDEQRIQTTMSAIVLLHPSSPTRSNEAEAVGPRLSTSSLPENSNSVVRQKLYRRWSPIPLSDRRYQRKTGYNSQISYSGSKPASSRCSLLMPVSARPSSSLSTLDVPASPRIDDRILVFSIFLLAFSSHNYHLDFRGRVDRLENESQLDDRLFVTMATDLSYLVASEEPSRVISVQMLLVTMQWLTTNHQAFTQVMISQTVLEKLIRQNVKRVELTHLPDMYDPKTVIPRTAKIYTKGENTEKFVLILEGRALVTIGQDEMTFEAGPWHAFGTELLERICEHMKTDRPLNSSRCSLTDRADGNKEKKIGFTPDYSVIVRDDCTFLEISATSYQLAYKTTLISRGPRPSVGEGATPSMHSPLLPYPRTGSQTSVDLVTPKGPRDLDPIARLKRNGNASTKMRSSSESEQHELIPRVDFLSPRDGSLFSEDSALSDN
ncbi:unnamed protein product, partial [Mesorhabditis belari]|uniref:CNNM transmembrane domain-containing protein n=1 Tax=Mesorhabditis belari TaxID=2138241 RepID=A0AAF3F9V8_9BILA